MPPTTRTIRMPSALPDRNAQPIPSSFSYQSVEGELEQGTSWAFRFFLAFGVIVFIAPQAFVPGLSELGVGKIVMFLALFAYATFMFPRGWLSIAQGSELKIAAWFFLLSLVSVSYSKWPGGSLQFFMDFAWKAGVVFFLTANLVASEERARQFCWAFALFAVVNSFMGLQNWRTGHMVAGATNRIEGGIAPLASNPNDLGLFLDMCIPLIWYAYRTAKTAMAQYAALLGVVVSAVAVVATFSRGAFLVLLVVAGIFTWERWKGKRAQIFMLIAVLLPVMVLALPAGYSDRMLSIVYGDMDETGSRGHRIQLMANGVTSMIEHPLGIGLGMSILASVDYGTGWAEIHNAYLQVGVELGVLGFLLYLLLVWKIYQGLTVIEQSPGSHIADLAFAIRLSIIAYAVGAFFAPVAYNLYLFYPGGMAVALKSLVTRTPHLLEQGTRNPHE